MLQDALGFQGQQILAQPLVIAMLAVPILIQVYFNSGLAYLLNRKLGVAHCVAGPSALIGASNFLELAVAMAMSVFGVHSGAALATVVGVLTEVPVMLSVVHIVNHYAGLVRPAWHDRFVISSKRGSEILPASNHSALFHALSDALGPNVDIVTGVHAEQQERIDDDQDHNFFHAHMLCKFGCQ